MYLSPLDMEVSGVNNTPQNKCTVQIAVIKITGSEGEDEVSTTSRESSTWRNGNS